MENANQKVLLVEDDKVNQFVASTILNKLGMEVTIANNGAEAVTQIRSKIFRLVLMDIQMPVMDGFEATRRIRSINDPYCKSVPIIAFTASGMIEIKTQALACGMNDFLTKPLDMEKLRSKINSNISSSSIQRPLFINFDLYTDGDLDFKREFINLLISNIHELQRSLLDPKQNASKIFLDVHHKVKPTISILNDQELTETLEEIRMNFISSPESGPPMVKLNQLNGLCNLVVESLTAAA